MNTNGSKYRGSKEFHRVYCKLISAAQSHETVYYMEVASLIGIDTPGNHMARAVGQVLGEISRDEHESGRPMLSAVAVSSTNIPSQGFFELASELGKFPENTKEDKDHFWAKERDLVYSEWAK